MPVTNVRLTKVSVNKKPQSQGTARVEWDIDTDDADMGTYAAITDAQTNGPWPSGIANLPKEGDTYDVDGEQESNLFLMDLGVEKHGQKQTDRSKVLIRVVGDYQTVTGAVSPGSVPTAWPMRPYWSHITRSVPIEFGEITNTIPLENVAPLVSTGAVMPLSNAAGMPFDDPIYRDEYIPVYNQQLFFSDLSTIEGINRDYFNTTNSDTFLGFAVETAFFLSCESGEPRVLNGITYYEGRLRIGFETGVWPGTSSPRTTRKRISNRGWKYYMNNPDNAGAPEVVNAKPHWEDDHFILPGEDGYVDDAPEPVELSLKGYRNDDENQPAFGAGPEEASYMEYRVLKMVSYADLIWAPP